MRRPEQDAPAPDIRPPRGARHLVGMGEQPARHQPLGDRRSLGAGRDRGEIAQPGEGLEIIREARRDVEVAESDQLFVLDVAPLLRAEQGSHTALPESWDVTSDSIAAHVAHRLQAAELVLLKSTAAPDAASAEVLSAAGYVDAYFPQAAGELFVRCVNLRD